MGQREHALHGASNFDVAGAAWDAQGTWTAQPVADSNSSPGIYAKHPTTEDVYYAPGGGYKLFKLDTTTRLGPRCRRASAAANTGLAPSAAPLIRRAMRW